MNRLRRRVLLIAAGVAVTAAPIAIMRAQAPAGTPQFEAATVKPGEPGSHEVAFMIAPGGRLTTKNSSLKALIRFAYDVRDNQITGGPNWLDSAAWDIVAKPEGEVTPGPGNDNVIRQMMQALLADRFKLVLHKDTKEQPVYALVVAKGGPKLKPAEGGGGGRRGMRVGRGMVDASGATVAMFAQMLSNSLGRSVLDKTGLTGNFDFKLEWTPDESQGQLFKNGADAPPPSDSGGPSIFTALQEQLGLRLESQKGSVEVLVIERAEKPSAN